MIVTTVARIFSPTHVALSAGSIDGVQTGMVFVIFSLTDEIFAPVTGESLGRLEIIKGRVKVNYVQEKMCQATTFVQTFKRTINPLPTFTSPFMEREVTESYPVELKVEEVTPHEVDLTVRVGDLARNVDP
jgi:hypothetical protein